jgi:hypothetical protein
MYINTYIDLLLYFTTVEMLDNGTEVLNINIVFYGAVSRTIKQPTTSTWLLSRWYLLKFLAPVFFYPQILGTIER